MTRRGERIRSRRRATLAAVVATALLVPVIGVASLSPGGEVDPQYQVAAGAPVPALADIATDIPSVLGGTDAVPPTLPAESPASPPERIAPVPPLWPTTTVVQRRVPEVNGSLAPEPPVTVVDDPVIRPVPVPTIATGQGTSIASSSSGPAAVGTTLPKELALPACPVAEVRVTVSTDKAGYAPGETVRFSSTLENRSSTTCLVSGRAFFSIENGAGKTVSSFAYPANYMMPVKAEPGQTFADSGTWDQRDCSGSACVQVPGGTYVVFAGWTEGGQYIGRGPFDVGA